MQNAYYLRTPAINFEPYRKKIYRLSLGLTRNNEDAEDLTQDTFIKAALHAHEVRNEKAIAAWLNKIAIHIFFDKLRNKKSSEIPNSNISSLCEEGHDMSAIDGKVDYGEDVEARVSLDSYLDSIPPKFSILLKMRSEGLEYKEMAEELFVPIGTVRSRLHKARELMKGYTGDLLLE